jgi:hypothetical protein
VTNPTLRSTLTFVIVSGLVFIVGFWLVFQVTGKSISEDPLGLRSLRLWQKLLIEAVSTLMCIGLLFLASRFVFGRLPETLVALLVGLILLSLFLVFYSIYPGPA